MMIKCDENHYINYNGIVNETAIVVGKNNDKKYFILCGDFTEELKALPTLEDRMKLWRENEHLHSFWSNKEDDNAITE